MKFDLAINLERISGNLEMPAVVKHTLDMVQMAEAGGFTTVWSAEHHALEMTIAPDPFQLLTWWGSNTDTIRLGTAVAVAPYWHPIKLAGEAAMCDVLSGGRLELGIGSGAYQREFDRMRPGLSQKDGQLYVYEMVPALKNLWLGDYEHDGEYWNFPTSTSVPKPMQQPHPPLWAAARSPSTFDFAIRHEMNVLSWPLTRPMSEAELYVSFFDDALKNNPGKPRPLFAMMRHTSVYDHVDDWQISTQALQRTLGQFENVFKNLGDVVLGFPKHIDLATLENREQYNAEMLRDNLVFGTPEQVIEKLQVYQSLGVDQFIYYASMGLDKETQKHSLDLFIKEVMPAFQE